MNISAISAPLTNQTNKTSSSSAISTNDFYKLLAAEIQYQDPLSGSDSSSGSGSNNYITELAIMSATTAIQNMTKVENYAMASAMVGKTAAYTSTSTSPTGKVVSEIKTGKVEACDFTSETPRCYIAKTSSDGKTSGEWVDFNLISKVYADDVTDDTAL
jgi:flagellar basal-body rod modification protein FlgD